MATKASPGRVAETMPSEHRETAKGGLAQTPTGRDIMNRLYSKYNAKKRQP